MGSLTSVGLLVGTATLGASTNPPEGEYSSRTNPGASTWKRVCPRTKAGPGGRTGMVIVRAVIATESARPLKPPNPVAREASSGRQASGKPDRRLRAE